MKISRPTINEINPNHIFTLEYAHCVEVRDPNGPDAAPNTLYEMRSVRCWMLRIGGIYGCPEDDFECHSETGIVGYGEEKEDAEWDLRYKLMDDSRRELGMDVRRVIPQY